MALMAPNLWAKNAPFLLGVGGFDVCIKKNMPVAWSKKCTWQQHKYITEILPQKAPNVNAVSIWITRDWQEDWYPVDMVQKQILDKGYTPLFVFYWFADDISPKYVQQHRKEYFSALQRFQNYLKKLKGKSYVFLNPEFNQFGIGKWQPFAKLLQQSIQVIKNVPEVKVGFCVGDFGNYFQLDDQQNWKDFDISIKAAVKSSDFIAFQEMRALTRNSTEEMLLTPFRSLRFSQWLYKKYKKPTFLAYLAVSSYGKQGKKIQSSILQNFALLMDQMRNKGHLIGFNIFHLFDTPQQTGYFGKAEKHFGLIDTRGHAKPSLYWFNKIKPE